MKTQTRHTPRLTQKEIETLKRITREERIRLWKHLIDVFGIKRCIANSYTIKKALDMKLIGEEVPQ